MALSSSRLSTVALSWLLLLLALAATEAAAEADPVQDARQDETTTRRFPVPPAPDSQQRDAIAVFRLKEMHPCKCENGGRCNRRVRMCECLFGFGGARCEIVDHEFFAEQRALEAAEKEREQLQLQHKEAFERAEKGRYTATALWLVYVAAVVATVLLLLMLRAFALIIASIYQGEKKKPDALPALYDDDIGNIYTLPLRPPPYSEKPAPICSSTPLHRPAPPCCGQRLLELQLQPDYLRTLQPLQQVVKQHPDPCIV